MKFLLDETERLPIQNDALVHLYSSFSIAA